MVEKRPAVSSKASGAFHHSFMRRNREVSALRLLGTISVAHAQVVEIFGVMHVGYCTLRGAYSVCCLQAIAHPTFKSHVALVSSGQP